MVTKKERYKPLNPYQFPDQNRIAIAQLRKKISKFGINPNDLGIFTRPEYQIAYKKRKRYNQEFS